MIKLKLKNFNIFQSARNKLDLLKRNFFNSKKHSKFFAILLVLAIVGLALPGGLIYAGNPIADAAMWIIYPVIYAVFMILFLAAYVIAWIGASILNLNLNPAIMNQVFSNPAIYQGWTIIRDVSNLLFLLLMLLVAFGTIVQSDRYNIKKSLPKLIMAIFLINFSNVIAGVIIDFGNILMYGILGWMCSSSGTCFQDTMGGLMRVVNDFNKQYSLSNAAITGVGAQQAIGIAIATIYTFMYGFILLAMAAFLLVRTAGLAILLILAPFAYFGEVMPGMEKIASKWWSAIWSYTLFGPIFALMLYIAGELARMTIVVPSIPNTELGAYGTLMTTIISNSIPLLFLLAIIPVTKELGLAGTDTIMKNTTGLGSSVLTGAAKYVGGATDRYMARGAQPGHGKIRQALSYLSPGAMKKAWNARKADQAHDYDHAAGGIRDASARLEGKKTHYKQKAIDKKTREDFNEENGDSESEVRARITADSDPTTHGIAKNHKLNELRLRKLAAMNGTQAMLVALGTVGANDAEKLQSLVKSLTIDPVKQTQLYNELNKAEKSNGNYDFDGGVASPGVFNTVAAQKAERVHTIEGLNINAQRNVKGDSQLIVKAIAANNAFLAADKAFVAAQTRSNASGLAADIAITNLALKDRLTAQGEKTVADAAVAAMP